MPSTIRPMPASAAERGLEVLSEGGVMADPAGRGRYVPPSSHASWRDVTFTPPGATRRPPTAGKDQEECCAASNLRPNSSSSSALRSLIAQSPKPCDVQLRMLKPCTVSIDVPPARI